MNDFSKQQSENFLILLRCIGAGDKTILRDLHGEYVAIQAKDMVIPEKYNEEDILKCLKNELYRNWPLSADQEDDFKRRVSRAFRLPN